MRAAPDDYRAFLEAKIKVPPKMGLDCALAEVATVRLDGQPVKDHQRAIVPWMVEGGRRAVFAKFGLGKSTMQVEASRLIVAKLEAQRAGLDTVGRPPAALIVAPLGVKLDMVEDARQLGVALRFVRTTAEVEAELAKPDGARHFLTNYESVREGKIDPALFVVVSLDEAAILRGFGGTKTFREFMRLFEATPYRFVATATPAPNEYIEILAYAAFLGIMDVGEAKTRFFKRNSEKADQLTLHPHKEEEFWLWVNSWAVFLQRPSDLGFDDTGYDLPELQVYWHAVPVDAAPEADKRGQMKLVREGAKGLASAAKEKRASMTGRMAKVAELVALRPDEHVIVWHDLEDERRALDKAVPGIVSVYGSQDLDERETIIGDFAYGRLARIGAKPVMLGSGCNLQRHCAWEIFAGVSFKFNDFIQAIHRVYRFLQTRDVRIDIIFGESELPVVDELRRKWRQHDEMMGRMSDIIRQYGLGALDGHERLMRSIGCTRVEEAGDGWRAINNDCVVETASMPANSVDLIVTSIPFGTQYEYSPSYNDFGHTDDDQHFFAQMDFLAPNLLRVLKPGRIFACHVKDRVRPGGMDGYGFQTVSPFHAHTILHYQRHGFAYMGMITITTDVVRENNQTYRLGWTEKCKDGTRMSVGMPEYVLLFRKPPTDRSDGYADERVEKAKQVYSRARWQTDAHAYWRSSGDRLFDPAELASLPSEEVYRLFRAYSVSEPYDYAKHVEIGEMLDAADRLPPTFMLLPPASWHHEVWTDVTRMRTLNGAQQAKGKEMHLCPLQFDIVDRLIETYTNPGEIVFDPFGGLMTVPLRAVKLGRQGLGVELSASYHADGVWYLRQEDAKKQTVSLMDWTEGRVAA